MSERTRKYRAALMFTTLISYLLCYGPTFYYIIQALNAEKATGAKAVLLSCVSVGAIISIVCVINKTAPRCRFLIILAGIAVAMETIDAIVIVLAITQATDELIVDPIKSHLKTVYKINREIDRRST